MKMPWKNPHPRNHQASESETIAHVCSKLVDTTLWTPDKSTAALVKLVKQTTPEQFKELMAGNTDTFIRKILGGSTTKEQSEGIAAGLLDKAGGKPIATSRLWRWYDASATVFGDWSYEDVVKQLSKTSNRAGMSAIRP